MLLNYDIVIKILLFFFFCPNLPPHDVQVAFFKIYQVKDFVQVDFVFEKEDLMLSLENEKLNALTDDLENYLQNKFSIIINNEKCTLNYSLAEIENRHISISGSLTKPIRLIQSIEIDNTCLLTIEDHSNIIKVRLHNQERDFLMNADRTSIKIDY